LCEDGIELKTDVCVNIGWQAYYMWYRNS